MIGFIGLLGGIVLEFQRQALITDYYSTPVQLLVSL
jgi:hypothetical protein